MKNMNEGEALLVLAVLIVVLMAGMVLFRVIGLELDIYTDAKTGCEYLVSATGHITPRAGADFLQAGCRGE